jgi:hypothetical protein
MTPKLYDLFLTHAWRYHDDWTRMAEMLDHCDGVKWRNFSVPWHDPAMDANTEVGGRSIRNWLESQIVPVALNSLAASFASEAPSPVHQSRAERRRPGRGGADPVDRHQKAEFEHRLRSERLDAAIDMVCMNREDASSSARAFRGVLHFINCSSVATYGREFDEFPTPEDHPLRPWTDYNRKYAIVKAQADEVFMDAFRSENFPVTLLKPSITYGPRRLKRRSFFTTATRIGSGLCYLRPRSAARLNGRIRSSEAHPRS